MSKKMTSSQFLSALAHTTELTNRTLDELEPFTTMDLSLVPDEIVHAVIAQLIDQVRSKQQTSVKMALRFLEKSEECNDLKKQIKK